MRYAFINIPSQELERPPAAAAAISACIKSCGWDCRTFDFNLFLNQNLDSEDWSNIERYWRCKDDALTEDLANKLEIQFENFFKDIIEYDPEIIGISVFTKFSILPAWETIQYINKNFDKKIMIGGYGAFEVLENIPGLDSGQDTYTNLAQLMLDNKKIDYYMKGDSEESIIEFINNYPDVEHVTGLNGNPEKLIKDLNILPLPDYSDIDPNNYYYTYEPGIYLTTSKGCIRRCSFCDIPYLWPTFQTRSAESVVDQMIEGKDKFDVNLYHFTDSLINGNMKLWREINQKLVDLKEKDEKYKPLKYMGQFICRRKSEQTEEDWELMAKGGAELLVVGIESFSPSVRTHMGKHFTNEDIDFHFEQSAKHGIKNIVLMFIGYPTETEADHEYNKEFLYRYSEYVRTGVIHMIRWGYTGQFFDVSDVNDKTSIHKKNDIDLEIDPVFKKQIENVPPGLQAIAGGFGWVNKNNPDLDLRERIRRRIELHELSVKLRWPTTRSREELQILYTIIKNLKSGNFNKKDFDELDDIIDFH